MSGFIGKYRNHQGVELEITGVHIYPDILGTIYKGVIRDELFGPSDVFFTPDGLIECGYVKTGGDPYQSAAWRAGHGGLREAVQELVDRLWATTSECTGIQPKHWRGIEYADGFEDATDEAVDALKAILAAHPAEPATEAIAIKDHVCPLHPATPYPAKNVKGKE